ncbi:MAG: hypothetical protein VYC27_01665 [Candidatus Thermoplasmatota archaeon]|nr:hypothetical protein [Candidatus Thermoplasmatota archaeon]MEE2666333.1 hypothetical protein [Candidatus Thermoplasmatota archaeon]
MGYEINWHTYPNAPVLRHPLYEKYRLKTLANIDLTAVKADLNGVMMDVDSAPVVAYLSWLIRCKELTA